MSKILIVEDEPDMVVGLKDNFEFEGYEVATTFPEESKTSSAAFYRLIEYLKRPEKGFIVVATPAPTTLADDAVVAAARCLLFHARDGPPLQGVKGRGSRPGMALNGDRGDLAVACDGELLRLHDDAAGLFNDLQEIFVAGFESEFTLVRGINKDNAVADELDLQGGIVGVNDDSTLRGSAVDDCDGQGEQPH